MFVKKKGTMATILIADDSQTFTMYMTTVLKRMRFRVLTAADGLKALELAHEKRPDVILLDIDMPGMDGKEVLRRLKEDRETESIPVIMLTIRGDTENMDECRQLRCDSFLSKPVEPAMLVRTLEPFA